VLPVEHVLGCAEKDESYFFAYYSIRTSYNFSWTLSGLSSFVKIHFLMRLQDHLISRTYNTYGNVVTVN
jgi:hypothetical protein